MSDVTQLAYCQLTQTDQLAVQLIRPAAGRTPNPAIIRILWPLQPTVVDSREFAETAALVAKLFAGASIELARISAGDTPRDSRSGRRSARQVDAGRLGAAAGAAAEFGGRRS